MNKSERKKKTLILSALMMVSIGIAPVLAQPEGFQLPNPSFTPGHPLYGLEMFSEEYIEVPLARLFGGPEGAAMKRLRLAEERLAEIEAIANGTNSNALEKLGKQYEFQMNRTEALANNTDSMDLDQWIANRTMHHIGVLTELRGRLPEQAWHGIDIALESSARSFGVNIGRMAVGIQQIEGQGVNATQLKMELETLRNRVVETVMGLNGTRDGLPTFGIDVTELNGTRDGLPTIGNDENIDTPEMPSDFTEIGNNTKRGPP